MPKTKDNSAKVHTNAADIPLNPGSQEAIAAGCICPVEDNKYGEGILSEGEILFWYTTGCPIHSPIDNQ